MSTRYTIATIGIGVQYEAVANAAITPGQAVELLSTGKIQKVAAAGGDSERAFAIEDYLQGKDVADDYAAGARVMYRVFQRGEEVFVILKDGENVAIGDDISFALAGEVAASGSGETVIGTAMEALDASASAGVAVASRRIVIRIK